MSIFVNFLYSFFFLSFTAWNSLNMTEKQPSKEESHEPIKYAICLFLIMSCRDELSNSSVVGENTEVKIEKSVSKEDTKQV